MTSPETQSTPPVWSRPDPASVAPTTEAGLPSPVPPAPITPAPAPRKKASNRSASILLALGGLIAIAGVAFAVGRVTAPAAVQAAGSGRFGGQGPAAFPSFAPGQTFSPGNGFPGGGLRGLGGGIQGTVTEVAADHLTLTLDNGTIVTVPIASTTTYHQESAAAQGDVTQGARVRVQVSVGGQNGQGGQGAQGGGGQNGQVTLPGPASDILILQP